jgi:hypothetical protein
LDGVGVSYSSVWDLVVAVMVRVCLAVILRGIWDRNWIWYSKLGDVCIPLPEHAGHSLLQHPKIRSRTLDGGPAVEVVHRLGRGVWHLCATHRWTTCMWINLNKTNNASRRRRINIRIIIFFPISFLYQPMQQFIDTLGLPLQCRIDHRLDIIARG